MIFFYAIEETFGKNFKFERNLLAILIVFVWKVELIIFCDCWDALKRAQEKKDSKQDDVLKKYV